MTEVINDTIEVEMLIDGQRWLLEDARVEHTRASTPNYTKINAMIPKNDNIGSLPNPIRELVGADFELRVDNNLISKRDTSASEDTLLYKGKLANISPKGQNLYEGIAYNPAQQSFSEEGGGGSFTTQEIDISNPRYEYTTQFNPETGTTYQEQVIKASEAVQKVIDQTTIRENEVNLADGGVKIQNEEGSYTGGYDRLMLFRESRVTLKDLLERVAKRTESTYYFKKDGTFYFGVPKVEKHNLRYITDASAGKTTPPYQSVRVVGSAIASVEGQARGQMNVAQEDQYTATARLAETTNGDVVIQSGETAQPLYEYHNLEISSQSQAKSAARSLMKELQTQQKKGKITVVGFPEVSVFDGVRLPQAQKEGGKNYSKRQPMGGEAYGVVKIVHKLNPSDGFLTDIHVGGLTDETRTIINPTFASLGAEQRLEFSQGPSSSSAPESLEDNTSPVNL